MKIDRIIDVPEALATGMQESSAKGSSGFTTEHAVVLGIIGVVILLMIARKRGWGPNID